MRESLIAITNSHDMIISPAGPVRFSLLLGGGAASAEWPTSLKAAFDSLRCNVFSSIDEPLVHKNWLLETATGVPPYVAQRQYIMGTGGAPGGWYYTDWFQDPASLLDEWKVAINAITHPIDHLSAFHWPDAVQTAGSQADTYFPEDDVKSRLAELVLTAVDAAGSSTTKAAYSSGIDGGVIVDAALTKAAGNVEAIISQADALLDTITHERMADGDATAFDIAAHRKASIAEDARDFADTAIEKAHDATETPIVVNNIIAALITGTTNVLEGSIAAAAGSLGDPTISAVLDDMVTAFDDRANASRMRAINRFTGGMADINAVYSSAFGLGIANLEADHLVDVRKYEAELHHRLFDKGMELFHLTFDRAFPANLSAYLDEVKSWLDTYKQDQAEEMRAFLTLLPQYLSTYLGVLPEYLRTHQGIEKGYEGVTSGIYSGVLQSFGASLDNFVRSMTLSRTARMQAHDKYIYDAAATITAMNQKYYDAHRDTASLVGDHVRASIIAQSEYSQLELDRHVKTAKWKMDVSQLGGNILAAPGGGTMIPDSPTKTQSALGGMATGAAIGAQTGNPIAAAIGAGAGFLGGLFW